MDNKVDKKTIFAAKGASLSYFAARIAVVAAAGIPARTTDTCLTSSSIPASLQPTRTMSGIIASLIRQNHQAFSSRISEAFNDRTNTSSKRN